MKIGIVTGASSGFGREFVKHLDEHYALDEIWIIARRGDKLMQIKLETKTKVRGFALDLSKKNSWDVFEKAVIEANPEVKILINNAGYGKFGAFAENELEIWENMIDLNNKAVVALTHKMLPYMKEGSEIINVASQAALAPVPYIDVYSSTKAFVLSFSRSLNMELKPRKIKAIAVCPFWTKTEFFNRAEDSEKPVVVYYSHYNTIEKVVKDAFKNLKKGKDVSISDFSVKFQSFLMKVLPHKMVMKIWCKQQKKPLK